MYEHFEFLGRVSVYSANLLLEELLKDIRSLETLPFRNPPYNRPYLPVGRYRIVYQIDDDSVFVDDIQDCRQDDDKSILREMEDRVR